jgi:hypothetical protein
MLLPGTEAPEVAYQLRKGYLYFHCAFEFYTQ